MNSTRLVAGFLTAIVVLYPLSMAPAMQIARAGHFNGLLGDTFWPLYKPLNWFFGKGAGVGSTYGKLFELVAF
jgi:hypothetical protein